MYKLRDYQKEASDRGVEFLLSKDSYHSGVIVAPTGSGKSLIIADIAQRLNGNVVVFQPSKELLQQNHEKFISYGNEAKIYSASMNQKEIGKVTFATIGSVFKKPELFKQFQYCLLDECHLVSPVQSSMYQQFLQKLNMKLLGLTATPVRLKHYNFPDKHAKLCMLDRTRPRVFTKYVHVTQIHELVEREYFAKTDYQTNPFDRSELQVNSTGGDYTEESMFYALEKQDVLGKITESIPILQASGRKHILVFLPSVREAAIVAEKAGGAYVSGKTKKKQREEILNAFKSGKIPFVSNVGVLTVGFDFPELDTVILGRPTMSLALYYQMIGRGVRPHPNKDKCVILDFVGNVKHFGRVEDLVIKDEDGWGVFTQGNRLLTNRDIATISEMQPKKKKRQKGIMQFGQHKGKKFEEVPESYMHWVFMNVDRKSFNKDLFSYIDKAYEFV